MNRRKFFIDTGAFLFSPALLQLCGIAESKPDFASTQSYSEEMPDMLVSYLTTKLNDFASAWNQKRALLKTAEEVEIRNRFVREKYFQMLGGFPERTPLGAVVVKVMQRDGYRVENVMFQSRPDFWVTGNLYLPNSGDGPFPGIISPCGHERLGRMNAEFQSAYLNMVKSGFVVLSYDPIGEGERRQYWNANTNFIEVSGGQTYEHSMPGQLLLLMGENLTQYRVWDGIRAVDYLVTRHEVDPKRIGCAGQSGGGTFTKFMSVADERIQCAVAIEGGMTNMWPVKFSDWEPVGLGDVEQNLFPAAIYGIDNVDLHVAIAPRPTLVGIEHYGAAFDRSAQAIHSRYRQLGAQEKFATVSADDPHGWTPKMRIATTDWFCRWFYDRPGPTVEPKYEIEPEENLHCTPDGSIRYSRRGETIFSLISKKQANLPPVLPVPKNAAELATYQSEIRTKIRDLLHFRNSGQPLEVRHIVNTPRGNYRIEKMQFLSESGIYVPVWVYVPENRSGTFSTVLYVNDDGMEVDGMDRAGAEGSGQAPGILDTLARNGNLVIAADMRGIGETRPMHPASDTCNEFGQLFDLETTMAYMAWFMNESLLGMRVQDVVRTVDYIESRPDTDKGNLHVIGKGMGALWCLYAAALDPRIRSLICVQGLLSYRSLTAGDRYLYGADVFVRDVLLNFDLPQVAAAVSGRPLTLIQPKDAMKKTVSAKTAEEAYRWTRDTYAGAGAKKLFRIESEGDDLETPQHYLSLIQTTDVV